MLGVTVLIQKGTVVLLAAAALALAGCGGSDGEELILATTTSTQDSGLLDELIPAFEEDEDYAVKTLAVGSGEALELGERGEADVLLVHSPAAEEELMATGKAGERRLVMHNDFVILGPPDDPAGIRGGSVAEAFTTIADAGATFVSRGDDSGTYAQELRLWEQAGADPDDATYVETGQGMGATLRVADERGGYTLADRGTYVAQPGGLEVLVEGDAALLNVYHVIDMTEAAGDRVNVEGAQAFAKWIVSPAVQAAIGDFGREEYGRPLFAADAGMTEAELLAGG